MANAGGTPRLRVTRAAARTALVEEIVPSSGWSEDSTSHYLIVDLSGMYWKNMTNLLSNYNMN